MSTVARLAMRNALRRKTRTLLTAGMVMFGVGMLMIALTWIRGAFGSILRNAAGLSGHVRIVDKDFAAKEELMPLDEHLEDVGAWIARLEKQPGVKSVEPRIMTGVTVTVGDEIGEVFGLAIGASERYFREHVGAKDRLIAGTWFTGAEGEIIAGAKVVEQSGAKVGDEMLLLGMTQDGAISPIKGTVVGVVKSGSMLDSQVFLPLDRLQYLTDIEGGATELLVYTDRYEDADRIASNLQELPELAGYTVEPFSEREPWKSMAGTAQAIQGVIVFIVVFLTALGIWNTMMMSVLERTHEIGVLRAMGLSRASTVFLFVGEAVAIGLIGGLAGIALGAYPAWLLESVGLRIGERTAANMPIAMSETIRGELSLSTILIAFGLGLLMAIIGSFVPSLRASSIQPVSAMRSGR